MNDNLEETIFPFVQQNFHCVFVIIFLRETSQKLSWLIMIWNGLELPEAEIGIEWIYLELKKRKAPDLLVGSRTVSITSSSLSVTDWFSHYVSHYALFINVFIFIKY